MSEQVVPSPAPEPEEHHSHLVRNAAAGAAMVAIAAAGYIGAKHMNHGEADPVTSGDEIARKAKHRPPKVGKPSHPKHVGPKRNYPEMPGPPVPPPYNSEMVAFEEPEVAERPHGITISGGGGNGHKQNKGKKHKGGPGRPHGITIEPRRGTKHKHLKPPKAHPGKPHGPKPTKPPLTA